MFNKTDKKQEWITQEIQDLMNERRKLKVKLIEYK